MGDTAYGPLIPVYFCAVEAEVVGHGLVEGCWGSWRDTSCSGTK